MRSSGSQLSEKVYFLVAPGVRVQAGVTGWTER